MDVARKIGEKLFSPCASGLFDENLEKLVSELFEDFSVRDREKH